MMFITVIVLAIVYGSFQIFKYLIMNIEFTPFPNWFPDFATVVPFLSWSIPLIDVGCYTIMLAIVVFACIRYVRKGNFNMGLS